MVMMFSQQAVLLNRQKVVRGLTVALWNKHRWNQSNPFESSRNTPMYG
jgi:hypothetical protein